MRYYDISVSKTPGGPPVQLLTPSGTSVARWQSHPNGTFDPAALDVEFDIYAFPYATPASNSFVRVWGVDLPTLANAVKFAGNPRGKTPLAPMYISVSGGMKKGLPLANPAQAGVLAQGIVWQSYGNWIGTDMTMDLLLNAGGASADRPAPILLNWLKGQKLSEALGNALSIAFPGTKVIINISDSLVGTVKLHQYVPSLIGLAQLVNSISQQVQGAGAIGVQISAQAGTIIVYDGTVPSTPKQINFFDLVGQPTWQSTYQLWVELVLRADINVGDTVKLPAQLAQAGSFVITPPQSLPAFRQQSAIQGNFIVTSVRHMGRFRATDGRQWSTTLICVPISSEATQ